MKYFNHQIERVNEMYNKTNLRKSLLLVATGINNESDIDAILRNGINKPNFSRKPKNVSGTTKKILRKGRIKLEYGCFCDMDDREFY